MCIAKDNRPVSELGAIAPSRSRGKPGRGQVDGTPRTSRVSLFDILVCYPVTVEDISPDGTV